MSFGIWFLLMALFGFVQHMRHRTLSTIIEGGVRFYLLAIGVVPLGFGLWRQIAITQGRHRCVEMLAQATDTHQRAMVYYRHSGVHIPSLDERDADHLTCERLVY